MASHANEYAAIQHRQEQQPAQRSFVFNGDAQSCANHQNILEQLDRIETDVEKLRQTATALLQHKETLTAKLTKISEMSSSQALTAGHKEEIDASVERIMMRLLSVAVKVDIPRTASQEEAYAKVRDLMHSLQDKLAHGQDDYKRLLDTYINACSSEPTGPADSKFQSYILSCTVDDQKQVRQCLSQWLARYAELCKSWSRECQTSLDRL